jgi:hypothetical protein
MHQLESLFEACVDEETGLMDFTAWSGFIETFESDGSAAALFRRSLAINGRNVLNIFTVLCVAYFIC